MVYAFHESTILQSSVYLTIIPRALVGYELAIMVSYPTSASGIIVLLKTPERIAIFELPSCFG